MTVGQFLQVLNRHRILIAIASLTTGLLVFGLSFLLTPKYSATTQLFVSAGTQAKDANELSAGGNFVKDRVKSYTELVTSPRVLTPVIKSLGLDTNPVNLAQQMVVENPLDTVVINVTVTDESAAGAADIANAVGTTFPKVVQQIEAPDSNTRSLVRVTVTESAGVPTTADGPGKLLILLAGMALGSLIGVVLSLLLEYRDTRISERRPPQRVVNAPVVGLFHREKSVVGHPLIDDQPSPRADAFRHLRTNIRFLHEQDPLHAVTVTSPEPGDGRSTIAANTAIVMARSGMRVALIDADLRSGGLTTLIGMNARGGLSEILAGKLDVDDGAWDWNRFGSSVTVIPAGQVPENPSDLIASDRMQPIVQNLVESGYFVIIDSPPTTYSDAAVLAKISGGAVMVVNVGSTTVEQLTAAGAALRTVGATVLGLALNNVPQNSNLVLDDVQTNDSGTRSVGLRPAGRPQGRPARRGRDYPPDDLADLTGDGSIPQAREGSTGSSWWTMRDRGLFR